MGAVTSGERRGRRSGEAVYTFVLGMAIASGALLGITPDDARGQTRTITGTVLALEDSVPIAGVSVRAPGVTGVTITGGAGDFLLRGVTVDPIRLSFSRLGLATDSVVVETGRTDVTVYLATAAVELSGILVETSPEAIARQRFEETAQASAVTIDSRDIDLTPTFLEADVIRTIQLLPGTGAVNDYTVGYNARGGEVDQNLIQLDGVTIFNPSHLGGLFSTFDAAAVGRIEYLKGGFPSHYSGRLSSVLDVRTRPGDPDGFGVSGQLSMLSSKLLVEGPLPVEGASFMVAGRRTYADKVIAWTTDEELPYHFSDGLAKLAIPLPTGGSLTATGYLGRDVLDWTVGEEGERTDPLTLRVDWGNTLLGLNWSEQIFGRPLLVNAGLSDFSTTVGLLPSIVSIDNDVRLWSAGAALTLTPDRPHEVRVGGGYEAYEMLYRVTSPALGATFLDQRYAPSIASAFLDDLWRPNDRLMFRPGVRVEHVMGGAGRTTVSPRVSAKAFLRPDFALTGSAGRYYQPIHSLRDHNAPWSFLDFWIGANENTPVAQSDHLVLGFEQWLRPNVSLSIEGYRKTFRDILNISVIDDLAVEGDEFVRMTGDAIGADVLLRKYSGRWNGWIAYSLLKAKRRDPFQEFAPAHDRRHMINVVVSGPGPLGSRMSARWGVGSPLPYTPVVGEWSQREYNIGGNGFGDWESSPVADPVLNGERYPTYSRLDVSFRWDKELWGGEIQPYVQFVNLYNRRNVFLYSYDYRSTPGVRESLPQMPFLPSFGMEFSF